MKILNLTLRNFKGIRHFNLDTQGKDVNIFGDNATGKTTLADAFMWLLFDKDSSNRKDFEIKTLGSDGEPEHGLEHAVEATLQLDSGELIQLKKVYQEKWTKKKGSVTPTFTGHTTDYFIDGVPVLKKEYDARIAEIAEEQTFRMLTDPRYFNEMLHWQDRRKLLLEVCGDVSDEEVIASKPELNSLAEIIGKRTIEQHKKVVQARRTEINKELEKIPVRIDEVMRGLPNIDDIVNEKELPNDIARLREELKEKQQEFAQAKAGGQVAEKTKELRLLEGQILSLKNKHREVLDDKASDKRRDLQKLQFEINDLKSTIEIKNRTIHHNISIITSYDEKMERLRQEWHSVNSTEFIFEQDDTCPACGQALPEEKLQEARDKALAQFNKSKADKLEAINSEGKKLRETKASVEAHTEFARQELEETERKLPKLEQKKAVLKAEIDAIMQGAEPVESTEAYRKLQERIQAVRSEIEMLQDDNDAAVKAVQKEVYALADAVTALEQAQARLEARKNGLKRIEQLKAEERKLATEYEELERQLYLTDEFIKAKVWMLDDRINSKFRMARFKMFNVLVNGGVEPCCETVYNGVPYSNLNNGARLNIGLDIINTLSEHYGFAPPVWLDNAESVTDILSTKGQQIRLIVSAQDKKLRIKIAEEELKEVV